MVVKWTGLCGDGGTIVPEGSTALQVGCALKMWVLWLSLHNGDFAWVMKTHRSGKPTGKLGGVTGEGVTPDGL